MFAMVTRKTVFGVVALGQFAALCGRSSMSAQEDGMGGRKASPFPAELQPGDALSILYCCRPFSGRCRGSGWNTTAPKLSPSPCTSGASVTHQTLSFIMGYRPGAAFVPNSPQQLPCTQTLLSVCGCFSHYCSGRVPCTKGAGKAQASAALLPLPFPLLPSLFSAMKAELAHK